MGIEELKRQISLTQVAQDLQIGVSRSQGRQSCPFCKSSSGFRVKDNQYYNCFACNKHGSIIDLVIDAGVCSTAKEAYEYLNERYGTKHKGYKESHILKDIFEIYEESSKFAEGYLESRGLDSQVLRGYYGYGEGEDQLQRAGYSHSQLVELGLASKTSKREYMNGRVVFPITNWGGLIQHLQGRAIETENELRWLSTSRSYITIDRLLFNSSSVKNNQELKEELYICEGITDSLSLIQEGLRVVGTLGININLSHHAKPISNFKKVYVCLDNDRYPVGHELANEYKSWRGILPALLALATECPKTQFLACSPPNQPGVKDINDWYLKVKSAKRDIESEIVNRAIPLAEFVYRAFKDSKLQNCILKYFYEIEDKSYLERFIGYIETKGRWVDYCYKYFL